MRCLVKTLRDKAYWIAGTMAALLVGVYLGYALWRGDERVFLTGATSDGHHLIEEKCEACHTRPFGGEEALQAACVGCHGEELKASHDSHPLRLFTTRATPSCGRSSMPGVARPVTGSTGPGSPVRWV